MSRQRLEPCVTCQIQARSVTLWLSHNPWKPYLFSSRRCPQIPFGSPEIEHVTTLQCFNPLMRLKANKSTGNWSAWNKGTFSVVAKIIWTHSCLGTFCQTVARATSTLVDVSLYKPFLRGKFAPKHMAPNLRRHSLPWEHQIVRNA